MKDMLFAACPYSNTTTTTTTIDDDPNNAYWKQKVNNVKKMKKLNWKKYVLKAAQEMLDQVNSKAKKIIKGHYWNASTETLSRSYTDNAGNINNGAN